MWRNRHKTLAKSNPSCKSQAKRAAISEFYFNDLAKRSLTSRACKSTQPELACGLAMAAWPKGFARRLASRKKL